MKTKQVQQFAPVPFVRKSACGSKGWSNRMFMHVNVHAVVDVHISCIYMYIYIYYIYLKYVYMWLCIM